ncbi:cytochrome c biogenesis protein CcdA [Nitrospirillum sp. BR 11163]|uniref:redoxin domain-containing protein n=1 Tax=Nitrospirillum sp. BR 11163 TaxID=3104323 RepID=UPI002B00275E|nr:cytochrome c biogenesis protein CcdA [Nitrospirillum sp. BR 11163]MEA1675307.1 cytochrome c biogenesis protein CcdA [Nitrospirillum sp. BR 11163]
MASILLAYLAGVLTVAAPCILPLLPIVLAPALADGGGFRRRGLPLLVGLATAFAVTASLAAAGGWAVAANQYGRAMGLAFVALFGLAMMWPALATRLTAPLVVAGSRLAERFNPGATSRADRTVASSLALGLATGLMWAPCAGPILGLILSAAALHGPGPDTTVALFFYALGAATPLAVVMIGGGWLVRALPQGPLRWVEGMRRVAGGAVVATAVISAAGLDTRLFLGVPALPTDRVERALVKVLGAHDSGVAHAATLPATNPSPQPPLTGPLTDVLKAKAWVNTSGLASGDLRSHVVLVNFWTYSCINCLRTLPHVRQWAAQYKDQGLVVVGVHTPEFAFERDVDNITKAAATLDVTYPVAVDNDYRIWRAFDNQAWPALYLMGADGRVIYQAFGEGDYDKTERVIRKALADAQATPAAQSPAAQVKVEGTQAAADLNDLGSPETYVGYGEGQRYSGGDDIVADAPARYRPAGSLRLNRWTLGGDWTVGREFATAGQAGARIAYRFHARDLHLVLAPGADGQPVRFRVRIDGAAPGADHGTDVDADGVGTVRAAKLYQLVRQAGPVADHTFEIEFLDPGARAYAFTFG